MQPPITLHTELSSDLIDVEISAAVEVPPITLHTELSSDEGAAAPLVGGP